MYHKVWFQNTLSAFQTLTNFFKHCSTLKKNVWSWSCRYRMFGTCRYMSIILMMMMLLAKMALAMLWQHKVAIVGSAGFHWAVVPDSTSFDSVFRPKGVWEQSKEAFVLPLSSSIFYFPALVVQTNSLMDFWSRLRLTITICCFKASAEIECHQFCWLRFSQKNVQILLPL